jgi:uncharacterized protein
MSNTLILFAKEPIPGEVKTRLIPALGEYGACHLYRKFVNLMLTYYANTDYANFVIYCNSNKYSSLKHFKSYFSQYPNVKNQYGSNLGEKMYHAMAQELHIFNENRNKDTTNKVILFGADCPFLTDTIMQQVITALDKNDLVFVPTIDGGYVLIAARKICPKIFDNITWSTSQVMSQTCQNLDNLGYRYQLLEPVSDIDEPNDLKKLSDSDLYPYPTNFL